MEYVHAQLIVERLTSEGDDEAAECIEALSDAVDDLGEQLEQHTELVARLLVIEARARRGEIDEQDCLRLMCEELDTIKHVHKWSSPSFGQRTCNECGAVEVERITTT